VIPLPKAETKLKDGDGIVMLSACASQRERRNPYKGINFIHEEEGGKKRVSIVMSPRDGCGGSDYTLSIIITYGNSISKDNFVGVPAKCFEEGIQFMSDRIAEYENCISDMRELIDYLSESMLGNGELSKKIARRNRIFGDTIGMFDFEDDEEGEDDEEQEKDEV